MAFLEELRERAGQMREGLDAKYAPDAPVPWDINRKDRALRFAEDFSLTLQLPGRDPHVLIIR